MCMGIYKQSYLKVTIRATKYLWLQFEQGENVNRTELTQTPSYSSSQVNWDWLSFPGFAYEAPIPEVRDWSS